MNFIDKAIVNVFAGNGGDGKMSFRHEKFIDKGGPDGGDGGNGGDVILVASRNQNTLATFRYDKELKAEPGRAGGKSRKHGRSGKDLRVAVPVGTVATTEDGKMLADLTEDGQEAVIAKGGKGGFGNAHFVSSRRQAPKFAEKGEPGEEFVIQFELKVIADVGLVGLPNAGKSTLLSRISNARPEIADYPFTTLKPNLGVVDVDKETSVLFADIPGLIEGASQGKGLGHEFLRHIERTAVLVHLIEAYQENVADTYQTVRKELGEYEPSLLTRPEIVVLTKIDGLDDDIVNDLLGQLQHVAGDDAKVMAISAQSGTGLKELLYTVKNAVVKAREQRQAQEEEIDAVPVLTLDDTSAEWSVEKIEGRYVVRGARIEQFARRTDFGNEEGVQRLRDIMQRLGIMHELVRKGINAGDTIELNNAGSITY